MSGISKRLQPLPKEGSRSPSTSSHFELSREAGTQLAIDLAKTWNRIFTTQFKTRLSPEVISQQMPRYELDVTSTVGFLAAENQLRMIQKGTEMLAKMAGWLG